MQPAPFDLTAFIFREGKDLITDSRAVAIAFGKRHKIVIRTIDAMLRSPRPIIAEHARLNFEPCSYAASNGKQEPMFRMTSKGLGELAMSFSAFGKRHKSVLRAIDNMMRSGRPVIAGHYRLNSEPVEFLDGILDDRAVSGRGSAQDLDHGSQARGAGHGCAIRVVDIEKP